MLTFVVGGGGFTGVEIMGELIVWVRNLCRKYDIPRAEVRLVHVEGLPTYALLDPKLIAKVEGYLRKKGVEVLTNSFITGVTPNSLTIGETKTIPTRTLIWTGGVKANVFVKELGVSLGDRDRIVTNQYLQTLEYPYVYAIGDNMEYHDKDDEILAPLVETAIQSADCAAYNIAADIEGHDKKVWTPTYMGLWSP